MFTLILQVFACQEAMQSARPLYERQIHCANSLQVDWDSITKVMRFLYGTKAVIVFKIVP